MQVTATEAKNRFGYFCARAKTEPVIVEKDGRPDSVILGYEEFQALKALGRSTPDAGSAGVAFYEQYKDWVDMQNDLVERFGIPGEEFRPW